MCSIRNYVTLSFVTSSWIASSVSRSFSKSNQRARSVGYIRPANLYGFSIEELKSEIVGIAKNYKRSSLPQRKLFDSTYCDSVPPIWMLINCLSYGNFKKIFYAGPDSAIKHKLASHMGIMSKKPSVSNEKLLRCWLENIRVARNKTATMTASGTA